MRRLFHAGALLTIAIAGGVAAPRGVIAAEPAVESAVESTAERDSEILAVLDQYMDALNALDIEAHVATYHFPHYRHASGKIVVYANAQQAMPILDVPESARREALRTALEPDWDRSEWTRRDIVQGNANKVHVATRFVRLRADGSVIKTFDSLYVMTRENGRWGIRGRSSFAP